MKRLLLAVLLTTLLLTSCVPGEVTETVYFNQIGDNTTEGKVQVGYFHDLYVDNATLYVGGVPFTGEGGGSLGSKWYSGDSVPEEELGIVGDYYLRNTNGDYYKKTGAESGNPWITQGNLRGEQGIPGTAGENGTAGYTPIKGVDYFDGATGSQGNQGIQGVPGSNANVTAHETTYTHTNIAHDNRNILDNITEAFTTSLKASYDWVVTNITSAWKSLVDNHLASTSNPHSVTKVQVGLTNVTDDAQIAKSLIDAKGDIITATVDNTPARLASSGVNNQVLTVDTTTATGLKWITPTGGGESENVVRAPGDVTNATTAFADITGMTFTPLANKTYIIEAWIVFQSNTVGTGIKFAGNGPTSPIAYVMNAHIPIALALYASDSMMASRAYNTGTPSVSVDAINSNLLAKIDAVLMNGVNSTPFTLRFAAETAGTVKVLGGSVMRYRQVN